ncbi:MAG: flagellar associated protein [Monoraphidium minutum]|nr:MAG: flagellar associated protein [Monoraphidium minutum]
MAAEEGDVDVAELLNKTEKIKILMRRDPRFIGRLIAQLDKHMHEKLYEKHQRLEAIKADEEALSRLDATIASHITPNLARVEEDISRKTALKAAIEAALVQQMGSCRDLEKACAALVSRARHTSGKLMSKTASDRLQEARGFSATVPTTQLIRGAKAKAPLPARGPAEPAAAPRR